MDWRRGHLLSEKAFASGGIPVSRTTNVYDFIRHASVTNFRTGSLVESSCSELYGWCNQVDSYYSLYSDQVRHLSTAKIEYIKRGTILDSLITVTNFFYDNPLNTNATRVESMNSKGEIIKATTFSPLEKANIPDLTTTSSIAIDSMLARNILTPSIDVRELNGSKLISRKLTQFKQVASKILPDKIQLQLGSSTLDDKLVLNSYDAFGNVGEQQKANDVPHAYLWGYSGKYLIAEVTNASLIDVAYTSFENDGNTTWSTSSPLRDSMSAVTGYKRYDLFNGSVTKSSLTPSKKYIVTFWSTSAAVKVNGVLASPEGSAINGWTHYTYTVTSSNSATVSISSGNAFIDELRICPVESRMLTYTYVPHQGISSITNEAGVTTYFEYDSMNRLVIILDNRKNVLQAMEYNYKD
jgi:hypothetical protein